MKINGGIRMDKIVNKDTIDFVMASFKENPFNTVISLLFASSAYALATVTINNANLDGSSLNKMKFAFDSYFKKS